MKDEAIVVHIKAIHREYKQRYGSPRMTDELAERGINVNHKRVERLMRTWQIPAVFPKKYRVTTDSDHESPVFETLLNQRFRTEGANKAWVSDITYIWTAEGWCYLAVVVDLFSRRVVGWATSKTLHRRLALRALEMAIRRRRPKPGLICHSDRGSQYASDDYRNLLAKHGLCGSMSGKGNCYDNAVAESFFATLKKELVHRMIFLSRSQAHQEIFAFIEGFYNPKRRHSALGNISPIQFENSSRLALAA